MKSIPHVHGIVGFELLYQVYQDDGKTNDTVPDFSGGEVLTTAQFEVLSFLCKEEEDEDEEDLCTNNIFIYVHTHIHWIGHMTITNTKSDHKQL